VRRVALRCSKRKRSGTIFLKCATYYIIPEMENTQKKVIFEKPLIFNSKIDSFFTSLFKVVLMFFLVYSFSPFSSYTAFLTDRITIVFLVILLVFNGGIIIRKRSQSLTSFLAFLGLQVFITLYCCLVLLIIGKGTGKTLVSYSVNFLIFYGLGFFAIINLFSSTDEIMKVFIYITLIQCFIILLCMISKPFCSFIDSTFNSDSHWDYASMRAEGYNGGIACITSTGVFQLCWGLVGCLYFLLKGRNRHYYFYSAIFVFITVVMTLVARTGPFLSLVFFVILMIATLSYGEKKTKVQFWRCWLAVLFVLSSVFLVLVFLGKFDSIFYRFSVLFRGGLGTFFQNYFFGTSTSIPPLSFETIIGTATVSGLSGNGVYINADGGFVRMYSALGLPLCVLYYSIFGYFLLKMIKKQKTRNARFLNLAIFICLLFLEFKEMHFGAGTFVTLSFVVSYLSEENELLGFSDLDATRIKI
jgi:hypothetical protein